MRELKIIADSNASSKCAFMCWHLLGACSGNWQVGLLFIYSVFVWSSINKDTLTQTSQNFHMAQKNIYFCHSANPLRALCAKNETWINSADANQCEM